MCEFEEPGSVRYVSSLLSRCAVPSVYKALLSQVVLQVTKIVIVVSGAKAYFPSAINADYYRVATYGAVSD